MKPNDKAIEAALAVFKNMLTAEDMQRALDAAYAAQFQSEDYAGLVKQLRDWGLWNYKLCDETADAIEALLAELKAQKEYNEVLTCKKLGDLARGAERYWESRWRDEAKENDKLKAELGALAKKQHDLIIRLEELLAQRDALKADNDLYIARIQAEKIPDHINKVENLESERDEWKQQAEICRDRLQATEINLGRFAAELHVITQQLTAVTEHRDILWGKKVDPFIKKVDRYWEARWRDEAKENNELKAERDALAARLAPVDDEALVEIAAQYEANFDGLTFNSVGKENQDRYLLRAREVSRVIRPHIEAAERERCAKELTEACELLHKLTAIIPGNDGAGEEVAEFLRAASNRR